MECELRPATEADREFCFRLNEACFRQRIEGIRGWDEPVERADAASQFRAGADSIIVLEGVPAGHLAVEEHADRIELRMMLFMPQAQGRGIGSSLMRTIMEHANSKRLPVALWVTEWNEGAIRFYRRFGFEIVETVERPEKKVRKLRMVAKPLAA